MSLRRYVLRRALLTIPVLLGISVLTFGLVKLLPGTPVEYVLRFQESTPELRASLRAQYHLDEPLPVQYGRWLWDVLHLEFGHRVVSDRSVAAAIAARLPATLLLGGAALLVALLIGVPAGVLAAVNRGGPVDEGSRLLALAGIATPNFWLGLLLVLVFGVHLDLVPVLPPVAPLFAPESLAFLVLPAVTLGTASAALFARLTRSAVTEELRKEYVRTARAKGLDERTVIGKHVLRNSLLSVVTVAAVQVAALLDGAVVIERVFSWPGIGRLLVRAILQRDFPVVQAVVLLVAVGVVVANLLADVLYAWLDPRIRY